MSKDRKQVAGTFPSACPGVCLRHSCAHGSGRLAEQRPEDTRRDKGKSRWPLGSFQNQLFLKKQEVQTASQEGLTPNVCQYLNAGMCVKASTRGTEMPFVGSKNLSAVSLPSQE